MRERGRMRPADRIAGTMTHSNRITDEEEYDDAPYGSLGPEGRSRASHRSTLLGIGAGVTVGLLMAVGAVWAAKGSFGFATSSGFATSQAHDAGRSLRLLAAAGASVTESSLLESSGALEIDIGRIYLTSHALNGAPLSSGLELDPGQASAGAPVKVARSVPLPTANPLFAGRGQNASDGLKALQELDGGVPLPQRNPLSREQRLAYAPIPDASTPLSDTPSAAPPATAPDAPPSEDAVLPTPGSGFALYDIKGKTVYMPNGDRLEAHSGYGEMFDDPAHVSRRMVGPTPPNTYSLTMRESLFHGVEAIRLNPIGPGKMYGRTGILAHTYLLGPRGDSNGCVSFKDYEKFLVAFKRGEIKKMVVVAQLENAPKEQNFLLSFLKPR